MRERLVQGRGKHRASSSAAAWLTVKPTIGRHWVVLHSKNQDIELDPNCFQLIRIILGSFQPGNMYSLS